MPSVRPVPASASLPTSSPDGPDSRVDVERSDVEHLLNCPTGIVEYYFASPGLRWSDELYRIHGYERGEIVPTLDLGVSHFVPEDRDTARVFWEGLLDQGGPRSAYFSLRDARDRIRRVLITGDYIRDATTTTVTETSGVSSDTGGEPVGVWALVVDLTSVMHIETYRIANEAVAAATLTRAVIEQAKSILMGRAGLTATEAFEYISRHSQNTNRKVVLVAQEIIDRTYQSNTVNQGPGHHALTELLPQHE